VIQIAAEGLLAGSAEAAGCLRAAADKPLVDDDIAFLF
jgi:hypothetical protein